MKAKSLIILLLISFLYNETYAQTTIINPELKDYIQKRVDMGINPGVSMAYFSNNETEFFNYGNLSSNGNTKVDKLSIYEIGSITKVFTCIILADEVLKGRMNLDDPASKYLPKSIKVPSRNDKQITLGDLATHTSALPRMPSNFSPSDNDNPFADYTVELLYEFLNNYQLTREIGVQYEYSNLGMGLLGHILELHTGQSFENLVINRIAKPLDMKNTRIVLSPKMKKHLALGHNAEVKVTKNWDIPVLAGAGALKSTSEDMLIFVKANLTDEDTDLSKAMSLSHEVAFKTEDGSFQIGLGWHYSNNNTITWHNGGTGGYKTFTGFTKDKSKAVVVLTNSTYSLDGVGLVQLGQKLDLTMPELPNFPEIITLENSVLESYTGKYQLAPAFFITISKKDNQLFIQATNQPEFEIYPSSINEFFLKVVEATIVFNANDSGEIESLILNQNGQTLPGKKVE